MLRECPVCRIQLSETALFCEKCGAKLQIPENRDDIWDLPSVLNTEKSLQWMQKLMQVGAKTMSRDEKLGLNTLLGKHQPPQPSLGQLPDEVVICAWPIVEDGLLDLFLASIMSQKEIRIQRISAVHSDGSLSFGTTNGLFVVTNKRILTYSFDPEWHWQTRIANLSGLEYEKWRCLKLFTPSGSYYNVSLSVPKTSMVDAFSAFSEDRVAAEASRFRTEQQNARTRDVVSLVLAFFNEIVYGAQQIRQGQTG